MRYSTIDEVIADRVRWATACMARLVDDGRARGWRRAHEPSLQAAGRSRRGRARRPRTLIPSEAAVGTDVDLDRLARDFEMSGGYIKNAVVRAAYLAADAGSSIGMAQLLKASQLEYEAMGKITFQLAG
jgi:hypothetical protein